VLIYICIVSGVFPCHKILQFAGLFQVILHGSNLNKKEMLY
jgi:hypothetical protein